MVYLFYLMRVVICCEFPWNHVDCFDTLKIIVGSSLHLLSQCSVLYIFYCRFLDSDVMTFKPPDHVNHTIAMLSN